jgi:hypothetical protein
MSFDEVISIILPPMNGISPHITGQFGEIRKSAPDGRKPGPHGGIDFNYTGGGASDFNTGSPTIYSPIDGTVVSVRSGFGTYNTIKISDENGNTHEFLHTSTQFVKNGDVLKAGDPIGSMGGAGPNGPNQFSPHVHYQIKDKNGYLMNPQDWWNNKTQTIEHQTYSKISIKDFDDFLSLNPLNNLITSLQEKMCKADDIRSPLVLDLNGDGVKTISKSAGIHFDLDGNGFAETTGWVDKNDGLLVLDKNGNGKIDNGTELFGNNTLLANGQKAANGFEAMKQYDYKNSMAAL